MTGRDLLCYGLVGYVALAFWLLTHVGPLTQLAP
jgi:hypothetical protein